MEGCPLQVVRRGASAGVAGSDVTVKAVLPVTLSLVTVRTGARTTDGVLAVS